MNKYIKIITLASMFCSNSALSEYLADPVEEYKCDNTTVILKIVDKVKNKTRDEVKLTLCDLSRAYTRNMSEYKYIGAISEIEEEIKVMDEFGYTLNIDLREEVVIVNFEETTLEYTKSFKVGERASFQLPQKSLTRFNTAVKKVYNEEKIISENNKHSYSLILSKNK